MSLPGRIGQSIPLHTRLLETVTVMEAMVEPWHDGKKDFWNKEQRRMTVATAQETASIGRHTTLRRSARTFRSSAREVYGKPLVYLDNGASAQKPQAVIDAVTQRRIRMNMPMCTAACITCPTRQRTIRSGAGKGAPFPERWKSSTIWFSPNRPPKQSILLPMVWADKFFAEGDEIVLSIMEHHSNIVPWHFPSGAARSEAEMGLCA